MEARGSEDVDSDTQRSRWANASGMCLAVAPSNLWCISGTVAIVCAPYVYMFLCRCRRRSAISPVFFAHLEFLSTSFEWYLYANSKHVGSKRTPTSQLRTHRAGVLVPGAGDGGVPGDPSDLGDPSVTSPSLLNDVRVASDDNLNVGWSSPVSSERHPVGGVSSKFLARVPPLMGSLSSLSAAGG